MFLLLLLRRLPPPWLDAEWCRWRRAHEQLGRSTPHRHTTSRPSIPPHGDHALEMTLNLKAPQSVIPPLPLPSFSLPFPTQRYTHASILRQLPHRPVATIPRGGANTSDHVDILGSQGVNEIILKVAVGAGDEVEDSYVSRIREYVRRIAWDP